VCRYRLSPQMSPIISGFFAQRDLQLSASFASSPLVPLRAQVQIKEPTVCVYVCACECVHVCFKGGKGGDGQLQRSVCVFVCVYECLKGGKGGRSTIWGGYY